MAMAAVGLYRRTLPSPPAIDFASPEGKKLFTEANHDGTMEGFFNLISYFQTQSEPAYCGLASLAMVLNALGIDPCRKWKGPWRFFDETMLDCCEPLENIKAKGISFGKVVCLAHCAGAKVEAFRTNQSSINEFRKYVMACCTSDGCHVISSYHRGAFKQTGSGHFSPIGGYHAESDMALILDVARFKYPPHWVPLSLLWEAMNTVDQATGLHRGFMLVSRRDKASALLYALSCKHESWTGMAKYLMDDVPLLLNSHNVKGIRDVFSMVFFSLPSDFAELVKWVVDIRLNQDDKGRLAIKEEVLKLVRETDLHKHVIDTLSSETFLEQIMGYQLPDIAADVFSQVEGVLSGNVGSPNRFFSCEKVVRRYKAFNRDSHAEQEVDIHPGSSDVLTALLLALPPATWSSVKDEEVLKEILALVSIKSLPTLLQEEILHLRSQLLILKRCKDCWTEDSIDSLLI